MLRSTLNTFSVKPKALRVFGALLLVLVISAVASPAGVLLGAWLEPDTDLWAHLVNTRLFALSVNTLVLVVGVLAGTSLIGISLAWAVSTVEFPGRKLLDKGLMLPFAIPAYVLAFVLIGVFDVGGVVPVWLSQLGFSGSGLGIRTTFGTVLVLSLAFYPYVYFLVRQSLRSRNLHVVEQARLLGCSPWQVFYRVTLPSIRKPTFAALGLVLMETLADFGAVSVLTYDTFTTAIYRTWFGHYSLPVAAQLASLLLLGVLLGLGSLKMLGGKHEPNLREGRHDRRQVVSAGKRLAVATWCWGIFALAFLIPVAVLVHWLFGPFGSMGMRHMESLLVNAFSLSALATAWILATAVLLAIFVRASGSWSGRGLQVAQLGYGFPGSVLAVGVMLLLTKFDAWLDSDTFYLTGTVVGLMLAYGIRFFSPGYQPIEVALARLRPSLPEAARTLGCGPLQVFFKVYLPVLMPGVLTAGVMVFVDVLKEMPATLLLRPFGMDTLAVRIYELTSEGDWAAAAAPSLVLVALGLIPVWLLVRNSPTNASADWTKA